MSRWERLGDQASSVRDPEALVARLAAPPKRSARPSTLGRASGSEASRLLFLTLVGMLGLRVASMEACRASSGLSFSRQAVTACAAGALQISACRAAPGRCCWRGCYWRTCCTCLRLH